MKVAVFRVVALFRLVRVYEPFESSVLPPSSGRQ
jgi:hypothetical protein